MPARNGFLACALVLLLWPHGALAIDCEVIPDPAPFYMDSVHTFQIGSFGGTDCWGWEGDDGTEYAIYGVSDGVAFFNMTTLTHVVTIPGPTASCDPFRWRDIKSYRNYCYIVSDCSGLNEGLMIVDMQYLPDSATLVDAYAPSPLFTSSHNFTIDTATGFAYIQKYGVDRGFRIVDLSDLENPIEVDTIGGFDVHDLYARNDTLWVAEGGDHSYSMWDVSNKTDVDLIVRFSVPNAGYAHNIWPTDDGRYAVTTEEQSQKRIKIWDLSDPEDVRLVGQILGPDYIAHNANVYGDYLFVAHYTGGVFVVDISVPECPREVARFDTWLDPVTDPFSGCWGVFPYTRSGRVYASNTDGRLFILSTNITVPRLDARPRVVWAPNPVEFRDRSSGIFQAWSWDFGDEITSELQNPMHTYAEGGVYDISLQIQTADTSMNVYQPQYVTVLAETLYVPDTTLQPGIACVWTIAMRNALPLEEMILPITLTNAPGTALLDSVSFVGTRIDYFEQQQLLVDNRLNGQLAFRLNADQGGGSAALAPGSGAIARVYLRSSTAGSDGDTCALEFTPLGVGGSYQLSATTPTTDYMPEYTSAVLRIVTCDCPAHGDVSPDGQLDALDLNTMIDYIFFNASQPIRDPGCLAVDRGDFNCDGFDDAIDLNAFIDAIFFNGVGPCQPCDCHGYPDGCP